jgi:hypothetical protein
MANSPPSRVRLLRLHRQPLPLTGVETHFQSRTTPDVEAHPFRKCFTHRVSY